VECSGIGWSVQVDQFIPCQTTLSFRLSRLAFIGTDVRRSSINPVHYRFVNLTDEVHMSIALGNITGGAQTGFVTPGYTVTADNPPDATTGKQWNVSAITGTQAGVRVHSISDPFTITFERPRILQVLMNLLSAVTGIYGKVPENVYTGIRIRKGINIAANNTPRIATLEMKIRLPAGSDAYDAANARAMISAGIGALNQVSAGLGDTVVTGTL
jgi:hypothetical protein